MGELVRGDDDLPVESDVGEWVDDKYRVLRTYLDYQAHTRRRFLARGKAGACYIDLFCGPGRALVRRSNRYVDGSPVLAWRASVEQGESFSAVYIADKDDTRRLACEERLRRLGAPVVSIAGDALGAAREVVRLLPAAGLHFAFIDPYSLGELRFEILSTLAAMQRIDMMVHLSAMDLFRNLEANAAGEQDEFDAFAPGWRERVPLRLSTPALRQAVMDYWRGLVAGLKADAGTEMKRVLNSQNRDLYWLLLISRHELARKFWRVALNSDPQRPLI
jgi:three-Cys-motif partner protein